MLEEDGFIFFYKIPSIMVIIFPRYQFQFGYDKNLFREDFNFRDPNYT